MTNDTTRRKYGIFFLLPWWRGFCLSEFVRYIETTGSSGYENKDKQKKQAYFLICESCFWCASTLNLCFIIDETIIRCLLCDSDRIRVISVLRG